MNLSVYKSSAGSGKTFALVHNFLKLALSSDKPETVRHILALTFTNKAAQEMKDRILASLKAFSSNNITGKELALFTALETDKELGLDAEALKKRSEILYDHVLYNYSNFSVSTIDKFNYRLIQTFGIDMGLSANAEVELDELEILEEAVNRILSQAAENEQLSNWLTDFLINQLNEDKSWNISQHFFDFSKRTLNENDQFEIDKIEDLNLSNFSQILERLTAKKAIIANKKRGFKDRGLNLLDQHSVDIKWFYYGATTLGSFFKNLTEDLTKFPNNRALVMLTDDKWYGGKITDEQKQSIDGIKDELAVIMQSAIEYVEGIREEWLLINALLKNIHGLGMLSVVRQKFKEICKERNVIPISDFNRSISKIVRNEPAPYIYERLGYRYRNFLLDEFQDTSKMQWYNLLPLVENGLSVGEKSLIVGDAKQAIYRWRGGDADQLVYLPQIVDENADELTKQRSESLKHHIHHQVLENNWRSSKVIVNFNNYFFEALAKKRGGLIADVFAEVKQIPQKIDTPGFVHYSTLDLNEAYTTETSETNTDEALEGLEQMNALVLEKIEQLVDAGFEYKDIAVLCRSNAQISRLSEYLEPKIDIVTTEGLLLFSHPSSQLLIATLKYCLIAEVTSQNGLKSRTLLAAEMIVLLHQLGKLQGDLHELLIRINEDSSKENMHLLLSAESLSFTSSDFEGQNAYQQLLGIVRIFKLGSSTSPYVVLLLEKSLEFMRRFPNKTVDKFVEWITLNGHKISLELPENKNAVRIMTIHKSKGLEFPAVIFPFANTKINNKEKLWIDASILESKLPAGLINMNKDLLSTRFAEQYETELDKTWLDTINNYYVAMTRAENALFILAHKYKKKGESLRTVYQPIIEELETFNHEEEKLEIGKLQAPEGAGSEEAETKGQQIHFRKLQTDGGLDNIQLAKSSLSPSSHKKAKQYGQMTHEIMRNIEHSSIWPKYKGKLKNDLQYPKDLLEKVVTELDELFKNEQFIEIFDTAGKRYLEREIIGKAGKILRPDCAIDAGSQVIVLDYKTGAQEEKHIIQILEYRELIERIENKKTIAYLVYTEQNSIIPVS